MNGEEALQKVVRNLLLVDPGMVEIIQFGSSVYAPEHARDLDILAFTKDKMAYGDYLDAISELNLPFDVDLVVQEIGGTLKEGFARQVLGAYRVLLGGGRCIKEVAARLSDPTFEEAWSRIRGAKRHRELSEEEENELDRDREMRDSFDSLFHAARVASMVYLSVKEGRWGVIRRGLPARYRRQFKEFIDKLHIRYFYEGNYPRKQAEFEEWLKRVEKYVKGLEDELKK